VTNVMFCHVGYRILNNSAADNGTATLRSVTAFSNSSCISQEDEYVIGNWGTCSDPTPKRRSTGKKYTQFHPIIHERGRIVAYLNIS
jgi:hypothetical protein